MAMISGGRRGEGRCLRRPGASGVGRLGEEEERDEAELVGVSERLGDGCGHDYGDSDTRHVRWREGERAEEAEELERE